jgi:hypothetical protein
VLVWGFISRLSQALNPNLCGSDKLSDSRLEIFYSDESSIFYPNNKRYLFDMWTFFPLHERGDLRSYKRDQCNFHKVGSIFLYYE